MGLGSTGSCADQFGEPRPDLDGTISVNGAFGGEVAINKEIIWVKNAS